MLRKEYRTYLQYRIYLLAQLARANRGVVGPHDQTVIIKRDRLMP
jgi:hypothetical protein